MDTKSISLDIDGHAVNVIQGTTILDACASAGVKIPSLCRLEGVSSNASCGLCVVEVEGSRSLVRSCVQQAAEGMKVKTMSARVTEARRTILELLLANHPADCLACLRDGTCELQAQAERLGVRRGAYQRTRKSPQLDDVGDAIVRDNDKCILCGRCIAVCRDVQGVQAIDFVGRGLRTRVAPFRDAALSESACVSCGQCTLVCPTGALTERDETDLVMDVLNDPEKIVVVQTAPAIRMSLGEALGLKPGSLVTGKWRRPCAGSASTGFSTPSSPPTSPSWRKATSSCSGSGNPASCP
jgi:NADH dehydrogenase/NADH:ubiquinone oxidoreductase subunit G